MNSAAVQTNTAVVRRGYDAVNAADLTGLIDILDARVVWHTPGGSRLAGSHEGREATIAHIESYWRETHGTFNVDLRRVLTDDDGRVIAIHHSTAERHGRRLDAYCCVVFELNGGRVIDAREHFDDLDAWDAFWA